MWVAPFKWLGTWDEWKGKGELSTGFIHLCFLTVDAMFLLMWWSIVELWTKMNFSLKLHLSEYFIIATGEDSGALSFLNFHSAQCELFLFILLIRYLLWKGLPLLRFYFNYMCMYFWVKMWMWMQVPMDTRRGCWVWGCGYLHRSAGANGCQKRALCKWTSLCVSMCMSAGVLRVWRHLNSWS